PRVGNHPHILSPNGATAGIITIFSISILPHLKMQLHTVTTRIMQTVRGEIRRRPVGAYIYLHFATRG
ncbi:MAG: hypothetical protein IKO93_14350, partial [Lentisphaeria bacterium]|nr:hypothetical protein [Lentisphaeria bacterium]